MTPPTNVGMLEAAAMSLHAIMLQGPAPLHARASYMYIYAPMQTQQCKLAFIGTDTLQLYSPTNSAINPKSPYQWLDWGVNHPELYTYTIDRCLSVVCIKLHY
jgi:hypothetical protein